MNVSTGVSGRLTNPSSGCSAIGCVDECIFVTSTDNFLRFSTSKSCNWFSEGEECCEEKEAALSRKGVETGELEDGEFFDLHTSTVST